MANLDRIDRDPRVMGGKPRVRGTRVTVGTLVGLLASGRTMDEVLAAYPYIEKEDVEAALSYAAWRSEEVEVPLRAA
ncbi:MAG: DUF433 domain-containing protein [Bacteroidota bacterium]